MLHARRRKSAELAMRRFLSAFNVDLSDPEFKGSPARIVRAYEEMLAGNLRTDLPFNFTTFSTTNDQLVVVSPIQFCSMCPHHFLPYFGVVRVGYLPHKKVAGLSKLPRLVRHMASSPLKQEDLTSKIADELMRLLESPAVIVSATAVHTCMRIRGVKDCTANTTTTAIRGPKGMDVRDEFYQVVNLNNDWQSK